LTALKLT